MRRLGARLIPLDESSFLLIPNLKRTWAPRGHTPFHYYCHRQGRIACISALAVSPKGRRITLYQRFQTKNITGLEVHHFLRSLLRQLRGPMVILWDRGSVHRDSRVKALLRRHPRLQAEFLPAYAPELNPAEYVWNQTDSALANGAPRSTEQLDHRLRRIGCRLRSSQRLLRACFRASELPWTQ